MQTHRFHLFELEDFPWFPDRLRRWGTLYIKVVHRLLRTDVMIAPLVDRVLREGRADHVVDLCSGAGGPMPEVLRLLRSRFGTSPKVTLTDLFPNRTAAAEIDAAGDAALTYRMTPVDAAAVPTDLGGARTMICSFHHMRPETGRAILADAMKKRQPFLLFEISDNAAPRWLWWLALPVNVLVVLLFTPLVRPLSFGQLFFTYAVPVMPLFVAWDGAVSNVRTYTKADLDKLLQGLDAPDYKWEFGMLRKKGFPSGFPYLIGLPT